MGIFGGTRKGSRETHTDPVCGMVVAEADALGPDLVRGEAYWFCSAACQHQFREREGRKVAA